MKDQVKQFLTGKEFAVIGASNDRNKYGNKVLRCYLQHGRIVYPVNPNESLIEGLPCYPTVYSLPEAVESISIITPPKNTEKVVEQALDKGIKNIWMQPGAESDEAIKSCKDAGVNIIANGPCLLVALGFNDL